MYKSLKNIYEICDKCKILKSLSCYCDYHNNKIKKIINNEIKYKKCKYCDIDYDNVKHLLSCSKNIININNDFYDKIEKKLYYDTNKKEYILCFEENHI